MPNEREIAEAVKYIRDACEYLDPNEYTEELALEALDHALELLGDNV